MSHSTLLDTVTVIKRDGRLYQHYWCVYWGERPDVTGGKYVDPKTKQVWVCTDGTGNAICFETPASFIWRLRYYLGLVPQIVRELP